MHGALASTSRVGGSTARERALAATVALIVLGPFVVALVHPL